ncbi:cation-translocating P-type ATPase [Thalassovita taeanensis]|uniref:Ca2+-transporting ATPase n=1 Tax=Thalassovita taeanensis TaxID=657014 RepID=A0A1H9EM86_9RHOB|nr:cation-transporting P-type ATPase [Thalassovita taeanensis]SEQ26866.1 Ca2+-transporting ATPase [Thalassovita taeanensis]
MRTAAITIIHSEVPGRLRLRLAGLRGNTGLAARLAGLVHAETAWLRAEVRTKTGSVILHHDPSTPHHHLVDRLRTLVDTILNDLPHVGAPKTSATAQTARPSPSAPTGTPWHTQSPQDIAAALHSNSARGLTADDARNRLQTEGPNLLPQDEKRSGLGLLKDQFTSLPVLMLGGSAVVSLATGGVADAVATLAVVMVNGVLGYVTEGQAESVIHALMESGTGNENVTVLRDGQPVEIAAADVVRGDLYAVRAGGQVVADSRLVSADRLLVDESPLTGETMPVEKAAETKVSADAPIGSRATMLHSGTIVTEGQGLGLVVATGRHTAAAQIALLSQHATRPRAPVEEELDILGSKLVQISLAACGALMGIGWMRGYGLAGMLKDALALGVAAVPEGLPVVATTTMALGLKKMEKRGILIRRIDAVESLGALQTICLDKTGTLTQNRMQVIAATRGLSEIPLTDLALLGSLAEAAVLNNDSATSPGAANGSSATERALMEFALDCGIDAVELRAARPRHTTVERTLRRPWMATCHDGPTPLTVVKGAPDAVLARCSHLFDGVETRPLTDSDRATIIGLNDQLAARPTRVLGFARGETAPTDDEVSGLTWLGHLAMVDPLRPGAKDFISALHRAGIETVMITGDQAATAGAIARELDLANGGPVRIIDSTTLTAMDPALLSGLARKTHVFARVSADQKLAIVQALQATGRVVAMTGDGVNDAPALKAANIGIAMGASGTDLARGVANVVIRDDELTTLIDAIARGRTVYRNIRRALDFLVTTNMSEIIVTMAEALHGPGEMESPMELLWINLVTDVLPGLGLALADPDADAMSQPPRDPSQPIIPREHMQRIGIDGVTIAASALTSHFIGLSRYGPGPQTRAMTFLSLSLGQLFYTMTCQRQDVRKLRPDKLFENRALDQMVLGSIGLAVLPFMVPPLGRLLGVARLGAADAAVAVGMGTVPTLAVLARRRLELDLQPLEGKPCVTL